MTGQSWFDPELQLAVETHYQQSITTKSTNVRRVRTKGGHQRTCPCRSGPSHQCACRPAATLQCSSSERHHSTTSSEQFTTVKLLDVEVLEK